MSYRTITYRDYDDQGQLVSEWTCERDRYPGVAWCRCPNCRPDIYITGPLPQLDSPAWRCTSIQTIMFPPDSGTASSILPQTYTYTVKS